MCYSRPNIIIIYLRCYMKQLLGPLGLRNQQRRPTKKEVFVHLLTLGRQQALFLEINIYMHTAVQLSHLHITQN